MRWIGSHILLLCLSPSALRADWPQFLGPNRDGSAPGESIVSQIPPTGRPILWKRPVGEGFSGPVVVGQQLFLFQSPTANNKGEEVLESLDIRTGQPTWKIAYPCEYAGGYGTGPGPRATPAVHAGIVFTFGATGTLQGVDQKTGKLLWRRDLAREYNVPEGFFGVGTSPLLEGDKLLVTVGAKKASLVAFEQATGKTAWVASDDEASYASPIVAPIGEQPDTARKGIFFARSGLHVVDLSSGKEEGFFRWRARMNASVNAATPVIVGNQIFLSAEYGTGAILLRWSEGKLDTLWKSQDSLSCHFNTPIALDGYLYGIDGRQEGGARLRCVNLQSGEPVWTEEGFGCASLTRVDQTIIAVTEAGEMVLWKASPDRYQELGRQRVGIAPTRAHPALASGILYVRTPTELLAIDLRP
jgi:outer membrane protein assembly factor BamB